MQKARNRILPLGALLVACTTDQDTPIPTCTDTAVLAASEPGSVRLTEHFDIRSDGFVCLGTAIAAERHGTFVAETMEIELRTDIPLIITPEPPDACTRPDGSHPRGCTSSNGVIHTMPTALYHEIGHSVACQLRNQGVPNAIAEGFATMFTPEDQTLIAGVPMSDVLEDVTPDYSWAGHVMRWLYERQGPESIADLYRNERSLEIVRLIELVYASTLTDLDDEYQDTAPARWVPFNYCDASLPHVVPDADGIWHFASIFDCDAPSTLGPYLHSISPLDDDEASQWMYQSFTIDAAEPMVLDYDIDPDIVQIQFWHCPDEHALEPDGFKRTIMKPPDDQGGFPIPALWVPGRWRVDVIREHGPAVETSGSFWRSETEPWW